MQCARLVRALASTHRLRAGAVGTLLPNRLRAACRALRRLRLACLTRVFLRGLAGDLHVRKLLPTVDNALVDEAQTSINEVIMVALLDVPGEGPLIWHQLVAKARELPFDD